MTVQFITREKEKGVGKNFYRSICVGTYIDVHISQPAHAGHEMSMNMIINN